MLNLCLLVITAERRLYSFLVHQFTVHLHFEVGIIGLHSFELILGVQSIALDLAPYNIRVNSICPGCVLTSASYREIDRLGLTFEEWRDRLAPLHMLNRLGEPAGRVRTGANRLVRAAAR